MKELSLFAALYTLLVTMGHVLRENPAQLTIMWPAAGLLLCALWLAPPRNWPWLLAVQFAIDIGAHPGFGYPAGLGLCGKDGGGGQERQDQGKAHGHGSVVHRMTTDFKSFLTVTRPAFWGQAGPCALPQ